MTSTNVCVLSFYHPPSSNACSPSVLLTLSSLSDPRFSVTGSQERPVLHTNPYTLCVCVQLLIFFFLSQTAACLMCDHESHQLAFPFFFFNYLYVRLRRPSCCDRLLFEHRAHVKSCTLCKNTNTYIQYARA